MICCFFGHHDTTENIRGILCEQVQSLIKNEGVNRFYVGTHGHFDYMAIDTLRQMKEQYPHISYDVVLAYMPDYSPQEYSYIKPSETIYPDGLEKVPRRFAINWRNDWMLKQSDIVICYVRHHLGGAGRMEEKATKQKKRVINLANLET